MSNWEQARQRIVQRSQTFDAASERVVSLRNELRRVNDVQGGKALEFRQQREAVAWKAEELCSRLAIQRESDVASLAFGVLVNYALANLTEDAWRENAPVMNGMLMNLQRLAEQLIESDNRFQFPARELLAAISAFGDLTKPQEMNTRHEHSQYLGDMVKKVRGQLGLARFDQFYAVQNGRVHSIQPS
jgi:hypothetical protein